MASDEALREALLELQILRERERAAHKTTASLAACLEALNAAEDPTAGVRALLKTLADQLRASNAFIVEQAAGKTGTIKVSDGSVAAGTGITFPFKPFSKQRNLIDLHAAGIWHSDGLDLSTLESVLVCPVRGPEDAPNFALVVFAAGKAMFEADEAQMATRLAPLAVQGIKAAMLTQENALLAATIQGSSSGFAIADARDDLKPLLYVNKAFEDLSGFTAAEVLGRNCRFLSAEPETSPERRRLSKTVASNGRGRFLLRNKRKSGEPFWNELTLFPVRDSAGEVTHLVATQTDATIRVQAEADRDALRVHMEAALRATEDAFLIVSAEGQIIFANAAMNKNFPAAELGWRQGTRFVDNWASYLSALPRAPADELRIPDIEGLASDGRRREARFPDGRSFLVNALRIEDGALVIFATNITAMKVAERVSRQQLAALDAALDGIALVDPAGRVVSTNPAAARLLGFDDQDEALGQKWPRRYVDATTEIDTPVILARKGADDDTPQHEITLSHTPFGTVLVIRDVTARLAEEETSRQLGEALALAQRREAVSQVTAGLAHDFNNVLSAIMGSASLITMNSALPEQTLSHATRIEAAGRSAAKLVNRLLDMGAETQDASLFDLRALLADLPTLLGPNLPSSQTLTLDTGDKSILVEGDAAELTQILLNMALNASDAIGAAPGTIAIRLTHHIPDRSTQQAVGALEAGQDYARIELRDTGSGIAEDDIPRLFEAYFSTKGQKGTGLGLAVAATQIRARGGAIGVETEIGTGTAFSIFWPLADMTAEVDAAETVDEVTLTGATLLLVDDDIQVAEVLAAYLESRGAEVAICDAAEDAAEALTDDPDAWSALITDYDMPGMNGGALVEHTRNTNPNLPIFVVTALARRTTDPRLSAENITGLFAKPVNLRKLAADIATALSDTQGKDI